MKKLILSLAALLSAGVLMAGSIDYLSNQSADFLRTFSRNASLDADAAVYNPAGTAFMAPGLTFALSNQSIFKVYENNLNYSAFPASYNKGYKSTEPTYVLPNGQVVWNAGNWALFLSTGVVAGGGTAVYSDGVPFMALFSGTAAALNGVSQSTVLLKGGNLTATSLYPQLTLGGAYAFNEQVSVSAGVRGVYGYKSFQGKSSYYLATLSKTVAYEGDATQTAFGVGAILGADWKALPGLLLTTRLESPTPLEFRTTVNSGKDFGTFFKDGKLERKDLPALVGLGVRYDWEALSVTASGTGFLIGLSKSTAYNNPITKSDDYDDFGWETGLSAEYAFLPGLLKASVGGMITKVGGNNKTYNDFDFSLDSSSVGGGVVYTPIKDLDLTLALSKTFYTDGSGQPIGTTNTTTYKKDAFTIDIGAQYKLF